MLSPKSLSHGPGPSNQYISLHELDLREMGERKSVAEKKTLSCVAGMEMSPCPISCDFHEIYEYLYRVLCVLYPHLILGVKIGELGLGTSLDSLQ